MLLSFVVPAYNEEAYLGACLESILDQTRGLEHLTEIIVVNNASTDRTREIALRAIVSKYGPRVRLVDESRKGLPFARQAGFLASTGSLIANVDADSRLTPGWVEKVLTTFRDSRSETKTATRPLVALSGPLVYYDLTPRQRRLVHVFYLIAWLTYATNKYILRVGSMVQGGNFVLSRAALEAIGGYDTSITFYGEDTDIARRLHAVGKVLFTFDLKMLLLRAPPQARRHADHRLSLRRSITSGPPSSSARSRESTSISASRNSISSSEPDARAASGVSRSRQRASRSSRPTPTPHRLRTTRSLLRQSNPRCTSGYCSSISSGIESLTRSAALRPLRKNSLRPSFTT